jgi:hypothetical protein
MFCKPFSDVFNFLKEKKKTLYYSIKPNKQESKHGKKNNGKKGYGKKGYGKQDKQICTKQIKGST